MIRDEDLRSSLDYSEGQKEAAHRVLVELVNLFNEYQDDIRIVGGWVPDLMFPGEGHVGSVDVDVLIKFASPNHAGPADVAAFLDLDDEEEIAFTKRDAYEQMQALIGRL